MEVYFSLGTNLGDRQANLCRAVSLLDLKLGTGHTSLSSFLETEPWGFESSERFLNAAIRYDLPVSGVSVEEALHLLEVCKEIEQEMGRTGSPRWDKDGKRIYTDRPIDIDILFIGYQRISTPRLTVPHPGIVDRDFVLIPLREILSEETAASFPEIFLR